jgi:hypothetical protein
MQQPIVRPSHRRWFVPWNAVCVLGLLASTTAQAAPLTSLRDQGLDHTFGSYAPRGDCSQEPRLTIAETGMTFRANGREVKPARVEYAVSFFGQMDVGNLAVFYPFPVSNSNFGPVIMFVNDGNKPGVIRFESDLAPGQRADPFHAAFTGGGLFALCKGSASAARPAASPPQVAATGPVIPAEWNNLASLVGKFPGSNATGAIDLFDKGAVAAALRARMGPKMAALQTNLSVTAPLQRSGNVFWLSGNAPQQGGVEQAYVMIDPARRDVQVGLWERGKLTVYPPLRGPRMPLPSELRTMLDNSPPETAVPLPGTPWEVVPVQGRAPIAYVSAAASPNIEALSLYCEGGKPFMAMLLNKPAGGNGMTMSWNFAGRLVNIPVQRANGQGTQWIGGLAGTPLLDLLAQQRGTVMLRINGRDEGEASLESALPVLRTAMRGCARL